MGPLPSSADSRRQSFTVVTLAARLLVVAAFALATGLGAHAQGASPAGPAGPAGQAQKPPANRAGAATLPASAYAMEGKVAYYSSRFDGRKTASGERFDSNALTMAHKTLPFGTSVKVTNLSNRRSVVVRVNDRGPAQPDRVADLSLAAARQLGMTRAGTTEARLEVVGQSPTGDES